MITRHQMSLAINDAELAIGEIVDLTRLFNHTANDTIRVNVPLATLRRLSNCYPVLNTIVNDPDFTCKDEGK